MSNLPVAVGQVVRDYTLGLAFTLAIVTHVVFNAASLDKAISLYVLFVFLLLSSALLVLVDAATTTKIDVRRALNSTSYPATLRAPVSAGFVFYIGAWLLWWVITQLFRSAGVVYTRNFMLAIVAPLVLAVATTRGLWRVGATLRKVLVDALLVALLFSLFFPNHDWAPQMAGTVGSMLRVIAYFLLVYVLDYLIPPVIYVEIDRQSDVDVLQRNDLEAGESARHIRMDAVLEAQRAIVRERARQSEIVALSAWILVTPLYVSLLLSVPVVALVLADRGQARSHQTTNKPPRSPPVTDRSDLLQSTARQPIADVHHRGAEHYVAPAVALQAQGQPIVAPQAIDSEASAPSPTAPPAPPVSNEPPVLFPDDSEDNGRPARRSSYVQRMSPAPASANRGTPVAPRRSTSSMFGGSQRNAGVVWRPH